MSLHINSYDCIVTDIGLAFERSEGLRAIMLGVACEAAGCRFEGEALRPAGSLASWQLRRIKSVALANFAQPVPISLLAEACQLSAGHFTKAFRRSTGESPLHWLLNLRVAVAKDFAVRTSLSTDEIAAACGFVDQSHMNKWFKRLVGMNIRAWQRTQLRAADAHEV